VLSTTATNWISSGYSNLKIPLEDILLENPGYIMDSKVGSVTTDVFSHRTGDGEMSRCRVEGTNVCIAPRLSRNWQLYIKIRRELSIGRRYLVSWLPMHHLAEGEKEKFIKEHKCSLNSKFERHVANDFGEPAKFKATSSQL
jgi:hypothetical protein